MRRLIVTADDFGIGPETSRGILDLARAGLVTSTVLLVNSPHAEDGIAQWRAAGRPVELGWHPCLTLDRPVSAVGNVSTLVNADGRFFGLGGFLSRLLRGRIDVTHVERELTAQYRRYLDLVGEPPAAMNGHHHIHAFEPVGRVLREILDSQSPKPFIRTVREPKRTLLRVPGARVKRAVLAMVGRRAAKRQTYAGFPGSDWLIGITDPKCVAKLEFFGQWLRRSPGQMLELTCHPGHYDNTLIGRDGTPEDGNIDRRPLEFAGLTAPAFRDAVKQAGFELVPAGNGLVMKTASYRVAA